MKIYIGLIYSGILLMPSYLQAVEAYDGFSFPIAFKEYKPGFTFLDDSTGWYKDCPSLEIHPGFDFNKPKTSGDEDKGEPIYAIGNGEVVDVNNNWSRLVIKHSFTYADQPTKTRYSVYGHSELNPAACHNLSNATDEKFTKKLSIGDTVYRGEQIGCISDYGTDGAHLHFEVRNESPHHPDPENGRFFCENASVSNFDDMEIRYENPIEFIQRYAYDGWHCGNFKTGGKLCWLIDEECGMGTFHQYVNQPSQNLAFFNTDTRAEKYECNNIKDYIKPTGEFLTQLISASGGDVGGGSSGFSAGGGDDSVGSKPTNLVIDLDIFSDSKKVDDKTVGYDRPLELRAELWSEHADAKDGAKKGVDRVETDFWISDDNKSVWKKIGSRQYTKLDNLKKSSHKKDKGHVEKITAGPFQYQAGTVLWVKACTDTENEISEKDEDDNCDVEKVTFIDPPYIDLVTHSFGFYHYTPKHVGDLFNLQVIVSNNGNGDMPTSTRLSYEYRRDGTQKWVMVDSDELKSKHLTAGNQKWEAISKKSAKRMPHEAGFYTFRACADYQKRIVERDESNNCATFRHEIKPPAFCANLPKLKDEITQIQKDYDYNLKKERYYRDRENHYRAQYKYNKGKYKKYKKKYKKKKKSKYKKKYKKYRARYKSNEKKFKDADRKKNKHEAAKKKVKKKLSQKRSQLSQQDTLCW